MAEPKVDSVLEALKAFVAALDSYGLPPQPKPPESATPTKPSDSTPPINLNVTLPRGGRVRKTITTHRDDNGNLVADVVEEDEQ